MESIQTHLPSSFAAISCVTDKTGEVSVRIEDEHYNS